MADAPLEAMAATRGFAVAVAAGGAALSTRAHTFAPVRRAVVDSRGNASYVLRTGLFDRIQSAAENLADQQAAGARGDLARAFPAGTQLPRRDLVRLSARFHQMTVEAYIATVGLRPEDVYAVIPQQSNDVDVAYVFVYRDRPEYEAGRAAWAAANGR